MNCFSFPVALMFSLVLCALVGPTSGHAGSWSSGGGDERRFYFEEGRTLAVFIFNNLVAESVTGEAEIETRTWLLLNKDRMAD